MLAAVLFVLLQFGPMPMGSLFIRTVVITGIFLFPCWLFFSEDAKYQSFLKQ